MNLRNLLAGVAFAVSAMLAPVAHAVPIQWTLSGVTFDDGGTASGTFSTDSATGNLLSYDLTTTGGTTLAGFHYVAANSTIYGNNVFTSNSFVITNDSPYAQPYLNLTFVNALTYTGVDALATGDYYSGGSWECSNCSPVRYVTAGIATSVPEPATVALVGAALLGFGFSRRKKA